MSKPRLVKCNRSCPECDVCYHATPHEIDARCTEWTRCRMMDGRELVAVRCCAVKEVQDDS